MYEPSEKIKEQIAKENWSLELGDVAEDFKKSSKATRGYYMKQANDWTTLPTIKKALELLENQPQWQDKPDKEGWCLVIEQVEHHGIKVYGESNLLGKHREHCLCYKCSKFKPKSGFDNCEIAIEVFAINSKFHITTPIFECPNFILNGK